MEDNEEFGKQSAIHFAEWIRKSNYSLVYFENTKQEHKNHWRKYPECRSFTSEELYDIYLKRFDKP